MNIETLSILAFFTLVGLLIYIDRKNVEFKTILVIRRTKRGIKLIDQLVKRHPKLLRVVGNIALIVCIVASVYGTFMLVKTFVNILVKPREVVPSVKLLFPQPAGVKYPSFVQGIPFWYWIIAVFIIISAHEPMHALFARLEGVKIRDMGIMLLSVVPIGAFANPDERQVEKLKTVSKLRIFAAGSFGNFVVAIVMLALLLLSNFVASKLIQPVGVEFESTIEGTPAHKVGLSGIIVGINNESVHSLDELSLVLKKYKPGDNVTINTTEGIYRITLAPNPENEERAFIGIKNLRTVFVYVGPLAQLGRVSEGSLKVIGWYVGLLLMLFGINLGVGIANLFPIKPLDGGLMLEEMLKLFFKKDAKKIANYISLITLSLLIINIFGPSIGELLLT